MRAAVVTNVSPPSLLTDVHRLRPSEDARSRLDGELGSSMRVPERQTWWGHLIDGLPLVCPEGLGEVLVDATSDVLAEPHVDGAGR